MCGIAGFITLEHFNKDDLITNVSRMTQTLLSRGPDDSGVWVDEKAGIALGHRRLSIIDTSSGGHQPMESLCGRYVISYNGEIYNFKYMRHDLVNAGHIFRSHSDTEVMLAAITEWGIENAVKRFIGMFAFALWDRNEGVLYLVRDRLGIKPLYYGMLGGSIVFGSELKSLTAFPSFRKEIDRNALTLMLRYNYIPAPYSIYENVYKLLPATIATIRHRYPGAGRSSLKSLSLETKVYWSAKQIAEDGAINSFDHSDKEAVKELDSLLRKSVKSRMISDVPLGAFLSGGIDSSTVVALMQAQSERPVKTFSIGFNEDGYNEAKYAKAVAKHLGTDHTELYVTSEEALAVIPQLPVYYDEPFADVSQIPTFLVSRLARKHVTVSLSGDGGDENFSGYERYSFGKSLWQKTGWMPASVQKSFAIMLRTLSSETWDKLFSRFSMVIPKHLRLTTPGDKIHKLSYILGGKSPDEMYYRTISFWKEPTKIVRNSSEPRTIITDKTKWAKVPDMTERMMFLDLVSYLPDDILTKVDRASMAVSLEVRVPLLDHRVVEFAWKVPLTMKIRNGQGKWLLRQVLYQYVPKELIERPKMGFGVPIDTWLRGPLRDWAESLLDKSRLQGEGYFNYGPIRNKWEEHLSGKRNWQYYLWSILMFQAWLENN